MRRSLTCDGARRFVVLPSQVRLAAGREAASEALQREASELLAQREALAAERLQMDAHSLTLAREAAAAKTELAHADEAAQADDRRAQDGECSYTHPYRQQRGREWYNA